MPMYIPYYILPLSAFLSLGHRITHRTPQAKLVFENQSLAAKGARKKGKGIYEYKRFCSYLPKKLMIIARPRVTHGCRLSNTSFYGGGVPI